MLIVFKDINIKIDSVPIKYLWLAIAIEEIMTYEKLQRQIALSFIVNFEENKLIKLRIKLGSVKAKKYKCL